MIWLFDVFCFARGGVGHAYRWQTKPVWVSMDSNVICAVVRIGTAIILIPLPAARSVGAQPFATSSAMPRIATFTDFPCWTPMKHPRHF